MIKTRRGRKKEMETVGKTELGKVPRESAQGAGRRATNNY